MCSQGWPCTSGPSDCLTKARITNAPPAVRCWGWKGFVHTLQTAMFPAGSSVLFRVQSRSRADSRGHPVYLFPPEVESAIAEVQRQMEASPGHTLELTAGRGSPLRPALVACASGRGALKPPTRLPSAVFSLKRGPQKCSGLNSSPRWFLGASSIV